MKIITSSKRNQVNSPSNFIKYIFLLCGICITLSACANASSSGGKVNGIDVAQEIDEYINDFIALYTSNAMEELEPAMIIEERDYSADGDNGALLVEYTDRSGRLLRYELCLYGETGNRVIDYYFCEHFIWIHSQENHYSSAVLAAGYPDILYSEDEDWILMGQDIYRLHDDKTLEKMDADPPEIPMLGELRAESVEAGEDKETAGSVESKEIGEAADLIEPGKDEDTAGIVRFGENESTTGSVESSIDRPTQAYNREADLHMLRGEYVMAVEALQAGAETTGDSLLAARLDYLRENLVLVSVERYKDGKFLQEMSYRYEYDTNGNETKNLYYSQSGRIFSGWEREYGPDGELLGYVCYEDGKVAYQGEYRYEPDGKLRWYICQTGNGAPAWEQTYREEYAYDAKGNLIEKSHYAEDDSLKVYEYDESGNLIKERYYDENDNLWCEYEYDSAGNLLKRIQYDEDGEAYDWREAEYDEAGNVTKVEGCDIYGFYHIECEYDENGNETKRVSYNEDGEILGWEEWKYNEAGKWTQDVSYDEDGGIDCRKVWKYNEDGEQTRYVVYNEYGGIEEWSEYEYDQQGRLIQSERYDAEGITYLEERSYCLDGYSSKIINYDDDGLRFWAESDYDKEGNEVRYVRYHIDGSIDYRYEFEYDENGVRRKDANYDGEGKYGHLYEYNEAGQTTKEFFFYTDRDVFKWDEYTYDQYGNCIHIDCFDIDGVVTKQEDKLYDALGNLTRHTFLTADGESVYTHINKYRLMGTWQRLANLQQEDDKVAD